MQLICLSHHHAVLFVSPQTYKAFLPAMIANNHGHLVSIASSAGLIGVNGLAGMCVFCSFFKCHKPLLCVQFLGDYCIS